LARKTVSCAMLVLLAMGMLILAVKIQHVKAVGTIYIRADGSIDPPTAPMYTADNITYTLTGNITADADMGIVIERGNIVVDGAFYTVQGTGVGGATGIYWCGLIKEISNVTIGNMTISAFSYGISIVYSPFCTISRSNITNNGAGLYLDSDLVTVFGNNITNNGQGIQVIGSNENVFENNITNNKDGITLQSSSNNSISENNITNNLSDNRLEGNGIFGLGSNLNSVSGNNITNNGNGIDIEFFSDCNTISGNNIAANRWTDIYAGGSSNNSISDNNITNSKLGMNINTGSNFNSVSGNNISNNNYAGIYLSYCSSNSFFHDNFVNNSAQASVDSGSVGNFWDDGYPSGGNYWSNYNGTDLHSGFYQNETGSDGIGDAPYAIYASDTDHYPLMAPFGSGHDLAVTDVQTSKTVVGQGYNVSITVTVADYGAFREAFSATVYANTAAIYTQSINSTSGESKTITFAWNTTGFAYGNYTISAYTSPVPNETNTANNNFTGGVVTVTMPGDINGDFKVTNTSLMTLVSSYGSKPSDVNWNPNADIDGNGIVGLTDLVILAQHYEQHFP
jgi:parallel beta-helix repeat protein